ncbi:MAG TPA: hypothetical protein VEH04_06025 [Verrucomicrobiae bacterium]|nr:hypothetical protein [Verrucomicrobiae bacterium]
MRKLNFICIGLLLCGLLIGIARADTFQLADGQTVTGEVVSFNESGLVVRLPDDTYSDRIGWTRFSQADLKRLSENSKITPFVEPFIEISEEERLQRTAIDIKPVPRLERPPEQSLFGALFSSSVGVLLVLVVYGANIYAAYEIAVFRARPKVLVCGVAAVAPIIGPIIFLSMPTRMSSPEEEGVLTEAAAGAAPVFSMPPNPEAEAAAAAEARSGLHLAHHESGAAAGLPPTQTFQRGAFTFNRRFFETKFPNFFGVVKREADKDMVLGIKAARGNYVARRITRITGNDIHLEIQKGHATEEVMVPFSEIQEIQLKHKDA